MSGRKTIYNPDTFPLLGEQFARLGLDDKQIAKKLGIGKTVFYEYQNKFTDFAEAVKRGKRPVDVEVINALLKRALGYDYEEKSTEVEISAEGVPTPTKIKTTKKHIPPDIAAIIFWAKNRMPGEWRDKQEIAHTDKDGNNLPVNPTIIIQSIDTGIQIAEDLSGE